MPTFESSFESSIEQAHSDLMNLLLELESGVRDREPSEVHFVLKQLQKEVTEHFAFEEEDGYMNAVVTAAPRFKEAIDKLLLDHTTLAATLNELIESFESSNAWLDKHEQTIGDWIKQLRKHEASETNLMQEAFNQDLGPGD